MLADPLTKANPEKGTAALEGVLDSGRFCFTDLKEEVSWRAADPRRKDRSRSLSHRRAQEEQNYFHAALRDQNSFPQFIRWSERSEEAESWGHFVERPLSSSDLDSHGIAWRHWCLRGRYALD